MPKTTKGILIKTDPATKVFLITLKEAFIIKDIDEYSLLIEESKFEYVKDKA